MIRVKLELLLAFLSVAYFSIQKDKLYDLTALGTNLLLIMCIAMRNVHYGHSNYLHFLSYHPRLYFPSDNSWLTIAGCTSPKTRSSGSRVHSHINQPKNHGVLYMDEQSDSSEASES